MASFDEPSETWVWRPATQLPTPDDEKHEHEDLKRQYAQHLAGRPVVDVFVAIEKKLTPPTP